MRFWSKGLGKRCLAMDCGKESVRIDGAKLVLAGTVKPPLGWSYTITMDEDDWLDFIELAFHPTVVRYLFRPRRLGLAIRAGWGLARMLVSCTLRLPAGWLGRPRGRDSVG